MIQFLGIRWKWFRNSSQIPKKWNQKFILSIGHWRRNILIMFVNKFFLKLNQSIVCFFQSEIVRYCQLYFGDRFFRCNFHWKRELSLESRKLMYNFAWEEISLDDRILVRLVWIIWGKKLFLTKRIFVSNIFVIVDLLLQFMKLVIVIFLFVYYLVDYFL